MKSVETKISKPNEAVLEDLSLFVTESASLMLDSGHPKEAQEVLNKLKALCDSQAEQLNVPLASIKL